MIRGPAYETAETIHADICIVGSGAAGLTLASQFLNTPYSVALIESGDRSASVPDPNYAFETDELPVSHESRARVFGGTTTKWSGRWKRLEEIDFTTRAWIPESGWPFPLQELIPFYERAEKLFDVVPTLPARAFPTFAPPIETTPFAFLKSEHRDWARFFEKQIVESPSFSLYLNLHVTNIHEQGSKITSLKAKSSDGTEHTIHAKYVVLAAGGIETARLLLASNIGNENDQVGRYYMDHPKGACGVIETYDDLDLHESAFIDGSGPQFGLSLASTYQRDERLLNHHIYLEPLADRTIPTRLLEKAIGVSHKSPMIVVRNYLEQAPEKNNRVTLGTKKDTFGVSLPLITWSIGTQERDSIRKFHQVLGDTLPKMGIGELESPLLEGAPFSITQDASHHMGTTRMGSDPNTSVTDSEGRVHRTENLYVAGSSLFPTSGASGPVATIAALSLRLADHLKTKL